MKKEEQIMLPKEYTEIEIEEMQYIEGGKAITIDTEIKYLKKKECTKKAKALKKAGYCTNMSVQQVAEEIHGHAIYGYGSIPVGLAAAISRQPYLVRAAISTIGDKGLNGISLGDNCDAWYRVAAYKLAWLSLI